MGRRRSSAGLDRGFGDGAALAAQLLGELHNQNRVLRRKADQHHQADLAVDIVGQAAQRHQAQARPAPPWAPPAG